ncbi:MULTISPECIES: hypothetical protein [unclassified Tardiphaga]|uniref:hypothetical protein n=1 Tax=unclassified Tardiphaga TaxID=2631404 RepID=UPI00143D70C5|nr:MULTISPECIES: hypothetical protein [unclassified Tardiphaga]MBC7583639.1 hypothetical protein [Tardiphaga sp.]
MTRSSILNLFGSLVLALSFAGAAHAQTPAPAPAPAAPVVPKPMQLGDVLSGKLSALRVRAAKGKRANSFQLVSEPRRLPAPAGLCNLETGPETFEIVAANDAQTKQLQKLLNKDVSLKVTEVACAEQAGQMSEALVTKWSVVSTPN